MRRRIRLLTAVVAGLALVLGAACGDDDPITAEPTGPADTAAGVSDADPEAGEEPVAGCAQLQERPDGVYSAGDAGEIELRTTADGVELVEVRPAEGWQVEDDERDDDEIEVTLREDEREIDVEAAIVDGELVVEVCES